MTTNTTAIVGGGITGLSTAYHLQQAGYPVEVFEKNSEPGGAIKSVKNGEWLVEYGPNTMLVKERFIPDLIRELGLHVDCLEAGSASGNRYIVRDGVLEPLPTSFFAGIGTTLFSNQAKLRVLKEPFIPRSRNADQSVSEFVERRLGKEILDYAINPFVAGIFANTPEELSLRHAFPAMHRLEKKYGSLILGAIANGLKGREKGRTTRRLLSFRNGLQQLPLKMAGRLKNIHYNTRVRKMEYKEGAWVLRTESREWGPYDHVVVNVPLYMWDSELLPADRTDLNILHQVNYPPLSVLHLGFRKDAIRHPLDGFGFLVPQKEERSVLGALFMSTLFPERAPEDHHLLTVFAGGGRQPELASRETAQLVELATGELRELLGITGDPVFHDHVYWPKSIPAYHVEYDNVLETVNRIEEQNPGLYIAGNFRNGISVPDCLKNGLNLADTIQQRTQ